MKISLIVAMASNHAIGLNGKMPWHLSADLKNFKKITLGFPIIMGRKTFESIGRPLPGRTNLIISSNSQYPADGCVVCQSLAQALDNACQQADSVFVIGGAELYQAALPLAQTLYITEIQQAFPGDTFFPSFNRQAWIETQRIEIDNDPDVAFKYSFLTLEKLPNSS